MTTHPAQINKSLFIILIPAAFAALTLIFTSCYGELTAPEDTSLDSARYSWEIDTIHGLFITSGWFADTNKIFFLESSRLFEYDGSTYTPNSWGFSFQSYCISGYDENNVYIGGTYIGTNNNTKSYLKKWNGASFENFEISDTAGNTSGFFTVYAAAQNELWLSDWKNNVYKFNGYSFQAFSFPPEYWYIEPFMTDETGSIYFSGQTHYGNPIESTKVEMQKFDGISWNIIHSFSGPGIGLFYSQNIGNKIYSVEGRKIKLFTGSGFVKELETEGFYNTYNRVSGNSTGSIICKGNEFGTGNYYIYHYNGAKWSRELLTFHNEYMKLIHADENKLYAAAYNYPQNISMILKGTRK